MIAAGSPAAIISLLRPCCYTLMAVEPDEQDKPPAWSPGPQDQRLLVAHWWADTRHPFPAKITNSWLV
jgi:hypothetical protein